MTEREVGDGGVGERKAERGQKDRVLCVCVCVGMCVCLESSPPVWSALSSPQTRSRPPRGTASAV